MPDTEKDDIAMQVAPRTEQDEGGVFIQGGRPASDGKHYGGRIVDGNGNVLHEFGDKEVNTGDEWLRQKHGVTAPVVPAGSPAAAPPSRAAANAVSIDEMGLSPAIVTKLKAEGYVTSADLAAASDEKLDAVDGVGPAGVKDIRAAVKKAGK